MIPFATSFVFVEMGKAGAIAAWVAVSGFENDNRARLLLPYRKLPVCEPVGRHGLARALQSNHRLDLLLSLIDLTCK